MNTDLSTLEAPAILAALLVGVGRLLKTWGWFPDKYIPTVLALLGVLGNCGYQDKWDLLTIFLGFAAGTTAVWGNQWWRQIVVNGSGTPTTPPIGIKLMLLGLPLFLLSGCMTALKSDKIVSVKTRVFGISVGTSVVNQTPEIKLGFITSVYQMIPTATNQPINAPRFFDTFEIGQGLNPFTTTIRENTGSGDVAIYTNAQGSAVIPKAQIPTAPIAPLSAQPK